jgi:hypothetical protein
MSKLESKDLRPMSERESRDLERKQTARQEVLTFLYY